MELGIVIQFRLTLSPQEFRLLSKALRGNLTEEEKPAALELQEKLMRERAKQFEHMLNEAGKAVENIEAKR